MARKKHVLVEVNRSVCKRLADLLRRQHVPVDEEESKLPGFRQDLVGNFFLALVAICYQTSPRHKPPLEGVVQGVHRRGWDYLFARLESAARVDASYIEPATWAQLSAHDVRELFRDRECGDRLTDPEGRAGLLRDLGQRMLERSWRRADDIYEFCDGRIASGHPNLLDTLAQFEAYRDPVRKKSLFFLSLMRNSQTWRYVDDENLGPPVDYHEVRGHLRIGTVCVKNADLEAKLRQGREVTADEDIAIRKAVYEAIILLSKETGLRNPSQLHYLFWNVFRSICTRQSPQCLAIRPDSKLPPRYISLIIHEDGQRRCPFSSVCRSARIEERYVEHVFETDYY